MVVLGPRDAVYSIWTGASNASSWQSEPDQVYTHTATPATLSNSYVWGRFSDATHRAALTGGPFAWEQIGAATHNFQQDGPSAIYYAMRRLEEFYYPANARAEGSPRGLYSSYFSYSTSSSPLGTAALSASLAMNPFAENVLDTGPAQLFLEGYVTEALQDLEGDAGIDNIYVDAIYYIGDELASANPAGSFATDQTKYEVAGGIADVVRGYESYMGVTPGSVPVIYVQTPRMVLGNANVAAVADVEEVRAQQAKAVAALPNPSALVDGELFSMRADFSHYSSESVPRIGETLATARIGLRTQPVLKTGSVRSAIWAINSDE